MAAEFSNRMPRMSTLCARAHGTTTKEASARGEVSAMQVGAVQPEALQLLAEELL